MPLGSLDMVKADTRLILSILSHGKEASPLCSSQRKRRGPPPSRRCPLPVPALLGDQDPLPMGGCLGVGARRGYTTQTATRALLSRRICAANRPRCHRHQERFPDRHLMIPWLRLLSRPFPLYFHHSYSRSQQRNHHLRNHHHLQVVTWNLKCLWALAPRTPINSGIIYPHRTQFSYILGQLLSLFRSFTLCWQQQSC